MTLEKALWISASKEGTEKQLGSLKLNLNLKEAESLKICLHFYFLPPPALFFFKVQFCQIVMLKTHLGEGKRENRTYPVF